jgi:hypothetical protein
MADPQSLFDLQDYPAQTVHLSTLGNKIICLCFVENYGVEALMINEWMLL